MAATVLAVIFRNQYSKQAEARQSIQAEVGRLQRATALGCRAEVRRDLARDFRSCASGRPAAGVDERVGWLESRSPYVRARLVLRRGTNTRRP